MTPAVSLLSSVMFFDFSNAFHVPLQGRRGGLGKREHSVSLVNFADVTYLTNLTLGGMTFPVAIDTASSDLFVTPPGAEGTILTRIDTGYNTTIDYVFGSVSGVIKTATMNFAGFEVKDQAYVEVLVEDNDVDLPGVLGLGPSISSSILATLGSEDVGFGPSTVDRIVRDTGSVSNYITLLLGRYSDVTDELPGSLTVGSLLEGYEAVAQEPKVPLDPTARQLQFRLDEDSLIGPNGTVVSTLTVVKDTAIHLAATAALDTSFPLNQVPKHVADALYGGIDGAEFVNLTNGLDNVWIVPCETEVKITFKIAGKEIPIHPLDATLTSELLFGDNETITNSQNVVSCIGSFQPMMFDVDPTFDMILGLPFLRNVHMLVNYGDYSANGQAEPFVQFLPTTTDWTAAHNDFITVRGGSDHTTLDEVSGAVAASDSNSESDSKSSTNPAIIAVAVVGGVIGLCAVDVAAFLVHSRRRKTSRGSVSDYRDDEEPLFTSTREVPGKVELYDPYAGKLGQ